MPNLLAPIHASVLAEHPGAVVHARGYDYIHYNLGGAARKFVTVGGGLHYGDSFQFEKNTDFGNSSRSGYADNNSTANFLCDVDSNTGRYIIPRRDKATEYYTLGRPQYWTGSQWRNLNMPGRIKNGQLLTWDTTAIAFAIIHAGDGIKYDVTLKNNTFATNIRWALTLVGLTWNNWTLVSNSTGKVVTRFRVPWMTDANGVTRQVAATYSGGYITFTPDYSGLAYPIVIDPTFTDGYGGDVTTYKDTMVQSGAPTFNFGITSTLLSNPTAAYKSLLEFDLSSIAAGSTCNSGTFYIYRDTQGASMAFTATLYPIAIGNAAWVAGLTDNSIALAGEPCWNALAADGAGGVTTAWAGSAGLSTAGTDYENSALGTFAGNRADVVGTQYSSNFDTTRVAGWFGGSNTNYGILLTSNAAVGVLASAQHGTTGYRPKFVVDWTAAGAGNPWYAYSQQ